MSKIRVLIADDHPIVRKGLRQLLESEADMQVVADSSAQDVSLNLLQKIFTTHPLLEQALVDTLSA